VFTHTVCPGNGSRQTIVPPLFDYPRVLHHLVTRGVDSRISPSSSTDAALGAAVASIHGALAGSNTGLGDANELSGGA
jgi:hypothetical protein